MKKYFMTAIAFFFGFSAAACSSISNNNLCSAPINGRISALASLEYIETRLSESALVVTISNTGNAPFCVHLTANSPEGFGIEDRVEIKNEEGEIVNVNDYFSDFPWYENEANRFACFPASENKKNSSKLTLPFGKGLKKLENGKYRVNVQLLLISPSAMWASGINQPIAYGELRGLPKCVFDNSIVPINLETEFVVKE